MSELPRTSHTPGFVKWGALALAGFLILLLLGAFILQNNADVLRGPVARAMSHRLNRSVHIDGKLTLHLLSLEPSAVAQGIRVANPAWAKQPDMVRIGRLTLSISLPELLRAEIVVPNLVIDDADVNLLREASQRANWDFTTAQPSGRPARLPVVRSLRIHQGHLLVEDAVRKLRFDGSLHASQGGGGASALQLDGNGQINGAPFRMLAHGDPLFTADRSKPYSFEADLRAGATHLTAKATLTKPFDLGALDAQFTASGDDLADVYYLTSLALPNTAPYSLTARIKRDGNLVSVSDLSARIGKSDAHGTISIQTGAGRPVMNADLASTALNIVDVAPSLGAPTRAARPGEGSLAKGQQQVSTAPAVKGGTSGPADANGKVASNGKLASNGKQPSGAKPGEASAQEPSDSDLLLPDAHLQVQRVRGMDATVHFRAASLVAPKLPLRSLNFTLKLQDGVINIEPLSVRLPQGDLSAQVRIDAREADPEVALDARLDAVQLSQFHPRNGQPPASGTLVGRIQLHGRGRSVHDAAATANGTLSLAVPHGEVREAFAELTGINVARGLGLLLTHNQEEAGIRCGVANFQAQNGLLTAKDIVIDTDNVLITGKGDIDLRNERLDLTINGQPKKFRLFRVKSPIVLGGTLRKPSIGLKSGNTPGQAGVAVALGTLLTPLAAALAFIDPGLAKSADCSGLLNEAHDRGAPVKEAAAPSAERTRAR